MMHESMGWMMALMWLFWLALIGGIILAIMVSVRALRSTRSDSVVVLPIQYVRVSSLTTQGPPELVLPVPGSVAPAQTDGSPPSSVPAAPRLAPPGLASTHVEVPVEDRALRLLDDDERRLYELVAERTPDLTQGDLVALSGFSKAKVSRVLDRLERKRLVVRLRRGMSNRVVLAPPAPQA